MYTNKNWNETWSQFCPVSGGHANFKIASSHTWNLRSIKCDSQRSHYRLAILLLHHHHHHITIINDSITINQSKQNQNQIKLNQKTSNSKQVKPNQIKHKQPQKQTNQIRSDNDPTKSNNYQFQSKSNQLVKQFKTKNQVNSKQNIKKKHSNQSQLISNQINQLINAIHHKFI